MSKPPDQFAGWPQKRARKLPSAPDLSSRDRSESDRQRPADGARRADLNERRRRPLRQRRRISADIELVEQIIDVELQEGLIVERSEEHTSELQSLMRISYA